jgi:hypothetical protein
MTFSCLILQEQVPQVMTKNKQQCADVTGHGTGKDNKFARQYDPAITKNDPPSSDLSLPHHKTGIKCRESK